MIWNPRHLAAKGLDITLTTLLSPPYGGVGYFHNHGPRDKRKIALTFDDGPSLNSTEVLLDAMGELGVKGTFFCVGDNVAMNPDLTLRMYKEGHIIGNHSIKHRRMGSLNFTKGDHIDESASIITQVLGREPRLYRPPWGWLTPWEGRRLHQRGYTIIGWDVYTLDWCIPEKDGLQIAEKARLDTKPGSFLLFHDAYPSKRTWEKRVTVQAIKKLVPVLQADGYEFVTVPELLNVAAYAPVTVPVAV
jgi:peptidoglycan-N-acetylglucosamine deacetylase